MEKKKKQPCRHLAKLSICMGGLYTLEPQSNSLKIKRILRLLIPTNTLWKDLMLNLIPLNSNQSLHKKRSLGLTDTRNCKNRTTKISLFNSFY